MKKKAKERLNVDLEYALVLSKNQDMFIGKAIAGLTLLAEKYGEDARIEMLDSVCYCEHGCGCTGGLVIHFERDETPNEATLRITKKKIKSLEAREDKLLGQQSDLIAKQSDLENKLKIGDGLVEKYRNGVVKKLTDVTIDLRNLKDELKTVGFDLDRLADKATRISATIDQFDE